MSAQGGKTWKIIQPCWSHNGFQQTAPVTWAVKTVWVTGTKRVTHCVKVRNSANQNSTVYFIFLKNTDAWKVSREEFSLLCSLIKLLRGRGAGWKVHTPWGLGFCPGKRGGGWGEKEEAGGRGVYSGERQCDGMKDMNCYPVKSVPKEKKPGVRGMTQQHL